ncbi:CidA/LrgA family protein [Paenibacillus sp. GCM10027626]|uniref:CidA/LrgA family protein n=1 Tax=Paenibacillus sp. GCM10027626 TaxID=3273411 RepID=UPI00362A45B1
MKKVGSIIGQIALLYGISFVANALVDFVHFPIPGSIVGIIVLFLLLQLRIVKLEWLEGGAGFLHKELLLFFIPASVGIMQYGGILYTSGVAAVATIVISTVAVLAVTGIAAQAITRKKERSL